MCVTYIEYIQTERDREGKREKKNVCYIHSTHRER